MVVRYQKYRSIAIPLNIDIEHSQVSRYFDISNQYYCYCINSLANNLFWAELELADGQLSPLASFAKIAC